MLTGAGKKVQAQRRTSTLAVTLEQVTLEDVAVHFSADEWALLERWQKALHQEVMQENYTLFLSLGHSVPIEELLSFIHRPEETLAAQSLGSSRGGGSDAKGEEPPLAEEAMEGPWELDCLSDEEEECLTLGSESGGDHQSSFHLCALMKLVKEIPEFLYGHGKASGGSSGCRELGPAAEVPPPQVKAEAHMENLHPRSLEANLAEVSQSLSSHPDLPASSTEGNWADPPIRGFHTHGTEAATNTEVAVEKNLTQEYLKPEKEAAFPNRPYQSSLQNVSPQKDLEVISCPMRTTDEGKCLPSCEGNTEATAESRSATPQAPARDSPHHSTFGDVVLRRAKGLPEEIDPRGPEPDTCHLRRPSSTGRPAATPAGCVCSTVLSPQESPADPGQRTLVSPREEGGATCPDCTDPLGSNSLSSECAKGKRLLPETVGKQVCQEEVSTQVSPNPSPEATAEEKPLQGLLKSLRELIGHQPHPSPQAACRPSTGDCHQVPRHKRRDVGSGSPRRPVKTEAAEEDLPSHSQRVSRRDGIDSSAWPGDSRMFTFWPAGGRRGHTSEAQASSPSAVVKLERVTGRSPLQSLERMANSTSPPGGAPAKERTAEETGGLRVTVKTELMSEEEPSLRGVQELPEGCRLQPPLPKNSTSPHCGAEAGKELGLWAPYSEAEWRPTTNPLHGLLNCLKEIPTPEPHPANILAGKREGGGERDRRKGGRRGRPGSEACLGEVPSTQPQLPLALPSRLRCDVAQRKLKPGAVPEGRKEESLGFGTSLQDLEKPLKELPPNFQSQLCSPAVSSSIGSSPDQLLRWTPETRKLPWKEEEEGIHPSSTSLQGQQRCLKELPSRADHQPPSPAISSSFSSSPDGLQRWTPEMRKWTRKEEGLSRNSTSLQGLGTRWKEASLNRHSQPCSPAISSSISSSPDGLHRWTLEMGKWMRKEEGPDGSLKGLPGTPLSLGFGPALSSCGSNSSDTHCTPEVGGWSPKEEGARPSRVSPLQSLENCLKEIPTSGSPCVDAALAPHPFPSQKQRRAEAVSPRPWPRGDAADSFLQYPTSTSSSTDTEASIGRSPLLRLMSCLQGIPIQRPSYLDTPSVSSSSSSCSEAERGHQSPGSGAWWDCSPESCQGLDMAVESGRMASPATALPSDKERCPSVPESRVEVQSATSSFSGLENCLKDIAGSQLHGASILPTSAHSHRDLVALQGAVHESCHASSAPTHGLQSCLKDPAARTLNCSRAQAMDPCGRQSEKDLERSHLEVQVPPRHAEEGVTESSPLQGLLRCLQEITTVGPDPSSSSVSDTRREERPTCAEEEADPGRTSPKVGLGSCLKERLRSRASPATTHLSSPEREKARQSPTPGVAGEHRGDVLPACVVGTCARGVAGSGHLNMLSGRAPVARLRNQRWRDSSSPKSGSKRSLVTARAKNAQAVPCSFEPQGNAAEPAKPPKKRCPPLELPLPSSGQGQGKGLAGLGGLGPVLSQKLDRLSMDMSALCRDVSRLQTHMDRLEQDAHSWVLELATLRLENRDLSEYVRRLESRCRTLENRSRRNNLRLLGLPEGAEGSDTVSFLQKTLPAILGLPLETLEIKSARRVQGGVSWDPSGRPRPLVFRLLHFANKAAILQAARRQPLSYAGTRVTILPDFCSSLMQRRRVPLGAVRRTRRANDLCFSLRRTTCSCGCAWTREPGGLLTGSGLLAAEREGRGPKGSTEATKWDTGTLEVLGQLGVGPSTSSFEQQPPTPNEL